MSQCWNIKSISTCVYALILKFLCTLKKCKHAFKINKCDLVLFSSTMPHEGVLSDGLVLIAPEIH